MIELDGLIELVHHVVHARDLAHQRTIVAHEGRHYLAQHDFDDVGHAQGLARRVGEGKRRGLKGGGVEVTWRGGISGVLACRKDPDVVAPER
jgi:hypothetical protein